MATDFYKIGRGSADRVKTIDYSKALQPTVDRVNKMAQESKAKTEALINNMPQGVPIEKVPEELRGQVTEFLAKNKQEYIEASKIIASGINPQDERYINAVSTINSVNNKFNNLSDQLENIALQRQNALDNRDHSEGAPKWQITDHESLANGDMYKSMQLQDDGSFNYTSADGNVKKFQDHKNSFQTSTVGQEAYFNLENTTMNEASKGIKFNRERYENAFNVITKGLKNDGARDFVFADKDFLQQITGEKIGTEEFDNAVKKLVNSNNFESILNQYKKFAVDELSKVHDIAYKESQRKEALRNQTKGQQFSYGYRTNKQIQGIVDQLKVIISNPNKKHDISLPNGRKIQYQPDEKGFKVRDDKNNLSEETFPITRVINDVFEGYYSVEDIFGDFFNN